MHHAQLSDNVARTFYCIVSSAHPHARGEGLAAQPTTRYIRSTRAAEQVVVLRLDECRVAYVVVDIALPPSSAVAETNMTALAAQFSSGTYAPRHSARGRVTLWLIG